MLALFLLCVCLRWTVDTVYFIKYSSSFWGLYNCILFVLILFAYYFIPVKYFFYYYPCSYFLYMCWVSMSVSTVVLQIWCNFFDVNLLIYCSYPSYHEPVACWPCEGPFSLRLLSQYLWDFFSVLDYIWNLTAITVLGTKPLVLNLRPSLTSQ